MNRSAAGTRASSDARKANDMLVILGRKGRERLLRERQDEALRRFHEWNDVTGFVPAGSSYEGELRSIIMDAVEIGLLGRTEEDPE